MGLAADLVEHIVGTDFAGLDEASVERAKWRILDVCGCALAGATAPGCGMMLDLVTGWGGTTESTILGHGGRAPAHNVAMMNSLMARSHDYEPVEAEFDGRSCPAHISGTTVPVALAMAEKERASGEDLLTALAIGDDLAARLGVNSGFDFDLGWDGTGTFNLFGAVATACKLLGSGESQVFNALGIALNRMSGTMAGIFDKTLAFKLPIACSAREAIFAAELAQRGFEGVAEPFLGPRGYFSMFCRGYNADLVTKDLGRKFYSDCVVKPYSACRITHPFIDCAIAVAGSEGFEADQVAAVTIHATGFAGNSFCAQPLSHSEWHQPDAAFSIGYCVAAALLWGEISPLHFTEEFLRDHRLGELIARMKVIGDIRPQRAGDNEVQMEVLMADGRTLSARTQVGTGDLREGQTGLAEVQAKFLKNAGFSGLIAPESAEQAMGVIGRLEDLEAVGELTRLLVKGAS
jgi:2-methylcitrate dehydratase PrpD